MSLLSVTTGCKGTRLKQMTANRESRECDVSVRSSSRGHGDVWERVIHHTAPLRSHSVPQGFNYTHFSGLSQHAVCERANSHQKSRELHSVASSTHLSEPWTACTLLSELFIMCLITNSRYIFTITDCS